MKNELLNLFKSPDSDLQIPQVPDSLAQMAGMLMLLQSIPYEYFLPCYNMLPSESIRFFYIDPNWINALVDGMYSLGRLSKVDKAQDTSAFDELQTAAWKWIKASRSEASGTDATKLVTGFMLRSTIVAEYPSMQVHAYLQDPEKDADPSNELPLIRLDHLTEDTLIGLFSGDFNFLTISKPPEMLHFGFEEDAAKLQINLRSLSDGSQYDPPNIVDVSSSIDEGGRINTLQIAAILAQKFNNTTITSAEFALEMIQGAPTVTFHKGAQ